jgi:hypothetical protein
MTFFALNFTLQADCILEITSLLAGERQRHGCLLLLPCMLPLPLSISPSNLASIERSTTTFSAFSDEHLFFLFFQSHQTAFHMVSLQGSQMRREAVRLLNYFSHTSYLEMYGSMMHFYHSLLVHTIAKLSDMGIMISEKLSYRINQIVFHDFPLCNFFRRETQSSLLQSEIEMH